MEQENYHKKYYESHKDVYKTKYVKKMTCECCNKVMVVHNYNKHKKTDKYKNNMRDNFSNIENCDKMIEIIQNIKDKLNEKNNL